LSGIDHRADIDGLRAVAVLAVLAFHVSPAALPGGFLGVDVFFVISGYLISLIVFRELAQGRFSFRLFYARRIRRLFPALILVLSATLALGAFALFADEYRQLSRHALAAAAFLLNFQLMREAGYFDIASELKPLLHLWSLSVEEQFYLIWPVLLVFARRWSIRFRTLCVLAVFGSFAFAMYLADARLDRLYFDPLARFWEILLGAALAYRQTHSRPDQSTLQPDQTWAKSLLSVLGLMAIGASLIIVHGKTAQPGPITLLPVLGTVALIASGPSALANRLLACRPIVWVGLISYPLYLWHWPLLSFLRITESGAPSSMRLAGAVGLSFLFAWATYRLVEQPIRHRQPSIRQTTVLATGIVAVLIVGAVIQHAGGFPNRSALKEANATLQEVRRAPSTDDACRKRFETRASPVYCREETVGKGWIVVTGDSHAHALYPGIADRARQLGWSTLLVANSGCPPMAGTTWGRNTAEHVACAESIETILDAIGQQRDIVAVVLASRGPQYLDGTGFGPVEAHYNHPPILDWNTTTRRGEPVRDTAALFQHGLENTVRRLSLTGAPVLYLLQVPELGVPVTNCVDRPMHLAGAQTGCTVNRQVYIDRMQSYRRATEQVAGRLPLRVIDPTNLFCSDTVCRGRSGGQLLYSDDNHVSAAGAGKVADLVFSTLGHRSSSPTPGPGADRGLLQ